MLVIHESEAEHVLECLLYHDGVCVWDCPEQPEVHFLEPRLDGYGNRTGKPNSHAGKLLQTVYHQEGVVVGKDQIPLSKFMERIWKRDMGMVS